ncbi:hypothetical protein ACLK19_23710 [Escherichia coli]
MNAFLFKLESAIANISAPKGEERQKRCSARRPVPVAIGKPLPLG